MNNEIFRVPNSDIKLCHYKSRSYSVFFPHPKQLEFNNAQNL